ncbi:MAG TPA: hypothetical protein PLE30_02325 [Candidatus Kapabacteria bacterium]|nr:hypothetical protein [Candidatus Kapabacteria bacterium]
MEQNSLKIFKISSILFVISFLIASILFFIPKAGNLSQTDYYVAIQKAQKSNSPILITLYSKWDRKQKISNQILFTDKNLLEQINKRLITVILNLDDDKDKQLIDQFGLKPAYSLLCDKNGKPITYIPNGTSSTEYSIFLNEALKLPFFSWDNLEQAINQSKQNNKNIVIFTTSNLNANLSLAELLKAPANLQYIDINFNPVLFNLQYKPDFAQARQILGFDDNILNIHGQGPSNNSPINAFQSDQLIKATIISPNKTVIAQGTFDEELFQNGNMQGFIEKILTKEVNRVK